MRTRTPTPPTYYVGAKLDDAPRAREIRDILTGNHGWHQTYDWTDYLEREKDATEETFAFAAKSEIDGVVDADVCVFVLPGGRGCWAEVGAALAIAALDDVEKDRRRKQPMIFICGDPFTEEKGPPVFYYHPDVIRIPSRDPEEICRRVIAGWAACPPKKS